MEYCIQLAYRRYTGGIIMGMSLKDYLTTSICVYKEEIMNYECRLLDIKNSEAKEGKCEELRKIYDLIQYSSCMLYAYELLVDEL